ncbi:Chromosome segregation protein SMC [Giardia duodenalis]|uniref:Chromosome segregation protein SMC n=1 Tax=Giardia intestinalis TaxID=5741 RepID=V6TZ95_GIAIN|nr:Chromosome segregation protein SMC [Giardia intestinalis]
MNESLHAEVEETNKSSMTFTLSTDDNIEEVASEHSFPASVHSVENLGLRNTAQSKPDSDDLSLSHLEVHTLSSEQKGSVIHSGSFGNDSTEEHPEADIAPQIFNNIEVIEEIHRKAQSTLFKCLQKENSFLRAVAASQIHAFDSNKPHTEPQVVVPDDGVALDDHSESVKSLQTSMTKSAMLTALQEQLRTLSASAHLYRQRAVRAEEQRRLALVDLNKETGKLKMLEQVVLDKDAEIHRLLVENLEASKFITAASKGVQQSPAASLSNTDPLALNSTSLDKQLEAVTRYSNKLEDKLRTAEVELKLYRDSIEEKDQRIAELSMLIQQKSVEMETVKEQLSSAEDLLRDQKEAAANYKSLFRSRSRALEKTTLLLNSKTNELDAAMRLASEIQNDTNGIAVTLTSKDQQIAELESQLSKTSKDAKALKILQLTLASQERQLKINDESIRNLEAQVLAKDNLIRTLTSTVDARDASIKDLEKRLVTMHSSATTSSLAIVSAEKQSLEYKQHVNQLMEEIKTHKESLQQKSDETTLLKRRLSEIDQLEEQRLKQTSQLIISYKKKEDDLTTVLQALADFEKKYADIAQLAAERDTEVQHLKQAVLDKDSEVVDLVARNGVTQLEISQLQMEIATLQSSKEELSQCHATCELLRERMSQISRMLLTSQTTEAFVSSQPLQVALTDHDSSISSELLPINELVANIVAFAKRVEESSVRPSPAVNKKHTHRVDASVQSLHHACCPTEDKGTQSMAPTSYYTHNNTELENLMSIISEKDRELVSLRDIIICKNEQIRRLLEDAEY